MAFRISFFIAVCLTFSACHFSGRNVPLPLTASEYSAPLQKKLLFSSSRKVKWHAVDPDSIKPRVSVFDISKLPSKPFTLNPFHAFTKPPAAIPFHLSSLPETAFQMAPEQPLVLKTIALGPLKKTTLGPPKVHNESFYSSFQYSDEQGLPGSAVSAILQARDGRLWLATDAGLYILNGESIDILPYNYGKIFYMAEDKWGQVWVRTRDYGVFVIDRKAGVQKQLTMGFGVHLRIDKKGYIWISSFSDGLYLINPEQTTIRHLTEKNGLSSRGVIRTTEDHAGHVWISNADSSIDIMDSSENKVRRLSHSQGIGNHQTTNLTVSRTGEIFFAEVGGGVYIIDLQKEIMTRLDRDQGIRPGFIFNMVEDDQGQMWMGTDSTGVCILNKTRDSIATIGTEEGLESNNAAVVENLKSGGMIVSTLPGGITLFPPSGKIAHHIYKTEGLVDDNVWAVYQDSLDRLWLGTYGGLNILTPDQKIRLYAPGNSQTENQVQRILKTRSNEVILGGPSGITIIDEAKHTLTKIGPREGLPAGFTVSLYEDRKGLIWIGTTDAGLFVYDPIHNRIHYLNESSGLSSNHIGAIAEDDKGRYWLAAFAGVDVLDMKDSTIVTVSSKEGLSSNDAHMLFKDNEARFWVGTEKGLNLLDPSKSTLTVFSMTSGLPSNGVYSVLEKDKRIFAGTGKGLAVLQENENPSPGENPWSVQSYGRGLGFSYMDFNGISGWITRQGQFVWGIVQGITVMDSTAIPFGAPGTPPQLTGLDILGKAQYFTDPALAKNTDTLWNEAKDTFYRKGSFETLNSDRKQGIRWDSLSPADLPVNLSLPPDRNYIRFHFGNSLPQEIAHTRYMYRLDGIDEKWSSVTDQTSSENYNSLSPGNYTFLVSKKTGNGYWSEPTAFSFRIRPPWWQTWWAELAYVLLFIGLIRFWVSYRSRRLLRENQVLEQKVTERTNELSMSLENLRQTQSQLIQAEKMASLGELTAGIAHEIQNPLNFVNNFSEVNTELLEEVNQALAAGDVPEAKDLLRDVEMNMSKITFHGKRADTIVKGMLLHSRARSGQKIPTDVNALADEYLRLSYHGLRAKDKTFNALFSIEPDPKIGEILLVQQDIGRVLLNIFNNAFYSVTEKKKNAPASYQPSVTVITKKKTDSVEIRIRDNGGGIPKKVVDKIYQPFFTTKPAGQGTGLGLSLSYDIITKEHNGRIDVRTEENEFTEFIIELPAQPATG